MNGAQSSEVLLIPLRGQGRHMLTRICFIILGSNTYRSSASVLTLSVMAGRDARKRFPLPEVELTLILELGLLDPRLWIVRLLRG